jgi:hypothetical protein
MPIKRLTDQFVERVASPASGRVEYFDAAFPALSLRVSQYGHKSWSLFYRVNGNPKLRRHKVGIYPQVKPVKARLLATEVLDQVRNGIDPGAPKKQARQDVVPDSTIIDALVRDYLASMSRRIAARAPTATPSGCWRLTCCAPGWVDNSPASASATSSP